VPFPERGGATLVRWSERLAAAREQARVVGGEGEGVGAPEPGAGEVFEADGTASEDTKCASSPIIQ
jgi:hypothetical protein